MDINVDGIREMRKRAGLTQKDVARQLGCDRSAVIGWEKGKWLPSAERLVALAQLYGCALDDLLAAKKE